MVGLGVGELVRISVDYYEPTLKGKTGKIVALPYKADSSVYLVGLDRGLTRNPLFAVRRVWISSNYIQAI
jgi:hypothetical protein